LTRVRHCCLKRTAKRNPGNRGGFRLWVEFDQSGWPRRRKSESRLYGSTAQDGEKKKNASLCGKIPLGGERSIARFRVMPGDGRVVWGQKGRRRG